MTAAVAPRSPDGPSETGARSAEFPMVRSIKRVLVSFKLPTMGGEGRNNLVGKTVPISGGYLGSNPDAKPVPASEEPM